MRRVWYPSLGAVAVDAYLALGLFALELPAALVLDPDLSVNFHRLRLAVGMAAALTMLFTRRGFPLALLAVGIADAQLRHLGSFALLFGAYAVARWEPDERIALGAISVAAVVCVYPQRWGEDAGAPIRYLTTAIVLVLVPAVSGFAIREGWIRVIPPL